MNRNIIHFAVRDRNGDTLIETDFPRLAAQRVARRAQIRRLDADYFAGRKNAARIVDALERPVPLRAMAVYLPADPAPLPTRGAMLVAGSLAVAALVLAVVA